MPRPTFLIVGASRCGTTTLWTYLRQHPDIFMPETKELRFFDQAEKYEQGLGYYESLFGEHEEEKELGEASAPYWYKGITFNAEGEYVWNPEDDVPARIHQAYPDLKIIISLRNPVSRMSSQYWKNLRQGREHASSLTDAVQKELEGDRDHRESELCWLYKNSYSEHLRRWMELYSEEAVMVLIFEEWTQDPKRHLRKIFRFLDVEDDVRMDAPNQHRGRARSPYSPWIHRLTEQYLAGTRLGNYVRRLNLRQGRPRPSEQVSRELFALLEEEVERTESLLGRSLNVWRP